MAGMSPGSDAAAAVSMLTARASLASAIEALRLGANDYLLSLQEMDGARERTRLFAANHRRPPRHEQPLRRHTRRSRELGDD
jgi:DNA-binding response OmpR family regulator